MTTVCFCVYEVSKLFKFIETEIIMVITMGWGKGEIGSFLMGIEFQFYKI